MPLKGLLVGLAFWLGLVVPVCSNAADRASATHRLLMAVVRSETLSHPAEASAHLQLLHALLEIELGMVDAAEGRLQAVRGSRTIDELQGELRLLLGIRLSQLGRYEQLATVMQGLPVKLSPEAETERQLLSALQLFRSGETSKAIAITSKLGANAPFLSPITLDLAVMLAASGETAYAGDLLRLLGNSGASSEYEKELRDRANLALARLLLREGKGDAAQSALERIRLEGPVSSTALLMLGWIRLELSGSEAALAPWMELQLRDANEPAVIEGRLAVALALAQRAPDKEVLDQLIENEDYYGKRLLLLESTLADLRTNREAERVVAHGLSLGHAGGERSLRLAREIAELNQLNEIWPAENTGQPVSAKESKISLLALLKKESGEVELKCCSIANESYRRLLSLIERDFADEQIVATVSGTDAKLYANEKTLITNAIGSLLNDYREELIESLQRQMVHVAGYVEQSRYVIARMNEAAYIRQIEAHE